jgi:hypothetical protein
MRNIERYELTCWRCKSQIEVPCATAPHCPKCGALLLIEWRLPAPGNDPQKEAAESAA